MYTNTHCSTCFYIVCIMYCMYCIVLFKLDFTVMSIETHYTVLYFTVLYCTVILFSTDVYFA